MMVDIFIVPENVEKLLPVKLPAPKNGQLQHFMHDEQNLALFEVFKFSDPHRSWFLDNQFARDGHYYSLVRIDPLYIFVPQLQRFAGQQFRPLADVCMASASSGDDANQVRLDYALTPDIDWKQICETKDLDGELLVRFSLDKTLDWLMAKLEQTIEALIKDLGEQASRATIISYAQDLIDQYLAPELGSKFKLRVKEGQYGSATSSKQESTTSSTSKGEPQKISFKSTTNGFYGPKINAKRAREQSAPTPPKPKASEGIMKFFKPTK